MIAVIGQRRGLSLKSYRWSSLDHGRRIKPDIANDLSVLITLDQIEDSLSLDCAQVQTSSRGL
jgi:hypothetical protein